MNDIAHTFEEFGLEVLEYTVKEADLRLRDGLTVCVTETPLFCAAQLRYSYVNPQAKDVQHVGVIYWPSTLSQQDYLYNVWPFDQNFTIQVLDAEVMLPLLKQMLA